MHLTAWQFKPTYIAVLVDFYIKSILVAPCFSHLPVSSEFSIRYDHNSVMTTSPLQLVICVYTV